MQTPISINTMRGNNVLMIYRWILLFSIGCLVTFAFNTALAQTKRPNIIVILADDMGYSDIGCYGSEIETPNIDRLATEGIRFTQFYNSARCCPSRASLLTGMYPHNAGMGGMTDTRLTLPAYQGYLNDACMTMGELFENAGYRTYFSGKWHVGDSSWCWPVNRGFEKSFALIGGATDYFDPYKGNYSKPLLVIDDKQYIPPSSNFYLTDAISAYAEKLIEDHLNTDEEKPFLLYLSYTAPHWPLQALAEDIERYKATYAVGWDSIRLSRYERMMELGVINRNTKRSERYEEAPNWNSLSSSEQYQWAEKMAIYAAMIDRMDQGIGDILTCLDRWEVADNTIVVFLSDNGGCAEDVSLFGKGKADALPGRPGSFVGYGNTWANVSNTPFRFFKSWMHEGGISTPFIMRYPNVISPGTMAYTPAHIIDVVPSLMEYGLVEHPDEYHGKQIRGIDGASLVPLIEGGSSIPARVYFWEHLGFRAVRKGDWKVVSTFPENRWELYNMDVDRSEAVDLSSVFPEKVEELDSLYVDWAESSNVLPWEYVRKQRRK
ncbi:arylsulfatase [Parapedobacter sp. 2B3]|uniref:arylsulfatase n=1 Tax=Parapedobacter sp. 2B3 TaxID=3342381 RepID=UPI0035B578A6